MRLGIDVGGTKTDAVAIDADRRVVERLLVPTGYGAEAVVDSAVGVIERLAAGAGLLPTLFESIGVGVPGIVDPRTRVVSHAVNLGFAELDLAAELERRLGVVVNVENDVNAAALGAYRLMGLGSSMAYLNLGTGLAAGLVVEGVLLRGSRGAAGEIGHIPVDPAGAVCSCGQVGCLEASASGSGIARAQGGHSAVPPADLFAAGDAGNAGARTITSQLAHGVAAAVRILVLAVDVETVVIGGGLSRLGGRLVDDVGSVLAGWAERSAFLASLQLGSRIRLLPEELPVAVVGAALAGSR